jgi:hypothetical protein
MSMMLRGIELVRLGLLFAIATSLSACHSGSSGSSAAVAYVRVANATQNGSLALALNQNVTANNVTSNTVTNVTSGVAPDSASGYFAVTAGTYSSTVTDAHGLSSSTVAVALGGTYYTVLVSERDGAIRQNVIVDSQVAPAGGFASFNAPNFSLDAGALDIYVVPPSVTTLTHAYSPNFGAVNYGSLVNPQLLVAGTYNVIVTANGNQNDVRFTLPSVVLSGGEMLTLALTGTSGGGLVNGVLIQQGGAIQVVPASTARVRVVAALASGTVSTTVGTSPLADVTSPFVGNYTLIPASSTGYSISVNGGGPVTDTRTTFATGGDYTILVFGSSGTATVLTDMNQTLGSDAVLRVVNGVVASPGVTLQYNFSNVASDVPLGASSGNVGVSPSNSSSITLSPSTITCPSSDCTNVNLISGGIYTYFVLNSTAPAVFLSKDR